MSPFTDLGDPGEAFRDRKFERNHKECCTKQKKMSRPKGLPKEGRMQDRFYYPTVKTSVPPPSIKAPEPPPIILPKESLGRIQN